MLDKMEDREALVGLLLPLLLKEIYLTVCHIMAFILSCFGLI